MTRLRVAITLLILLLHSAVILAKDPPKTYGPTPTLDKTGHPETTIAAGVFDGPPVLFTPSGPLSSIFFGRALPRQIAGTSADPGKSPHHLRTQTDAVPASADFVYTSPVSTDLAADNEASVAAVAKNAISYTTDAYMHNDGTFWRVRAANWTTTPNTSPTSQYTFPLGSGLTDSADPNVRTNPYTDGVLPGEVYTSFFSGTRNGVNIVNPMNAVVWGSADGGVTWTTTSVAASTTSTDTHIIDKPVMDVSWWPTTRGYIYVAWMEIPLVNGTPDTVHAKLQFRINNNGLWTHCSGFGQCLTAWNTTQTIVDGSVTGEGPYAPQVVVNSANGNVYVFWLDSAGELKMERYVQATGTWSNPIVVTTGINLIGLNGNTQFIHNIRAIVLPTIRYNDVTGNVMAIWHALTGPQGTTTDTAIYYTAFNADTITTPVTAPILIDATGAQLQPSIDNDPSGNALITYYSTQTQANNLWYQPFASCINTVGVVTCVAHSIDPNIYANTDLGDYNESYYWSYTDAQGPRWHFGWSESTSAPTNPTDEYLTGIR